MPDETKPPCCSRCEGPLDGVNGFPRYCKACRKAYDREYRALKLEMSETRGFAAGVSALREHLVKKFNAIPPSATFNGPQAAQWVKTEPFHVADSSA